MYMYSKDNLGDCPTRWRELGPGRPQIGAQNEVCPLLRDKSGGFINWQDYAIRKTDPKHPLSKFKRFLNEDCYKAFIESCKDRAVSGSGKVSLPGQKGSLRMRSGPQAPNGVNTSLLQRRLQEAWDRRHPGP